jgi:CCR4-NOT transcription complex subunit 4
MWCWHRIRESESGLCPACRTVYGEDPHLFSAVDVEEVLKANKQRDAALKRQKQQENHNSSSGSALAAALSSVPLPSTDVHQLYRDEAAADGRAMEVPKDRSQLANMRVIRRNLVYAVGLPPHLAVTEDTLRKPEYFGQYGKMSKIVLNRAAVAGETGRRASASAYVTFVHKDDTLACILALDGFYLENRNVRASYGTSKYCSAFIKNVRCNNPECTYLHEMGAAEDTFTKQEIQAGYVTSGRDVLARQQQIVAEQLRLGLQGGVAPRKRVGGGGPSGTGRATTTPIFPAPEYDEQAKVVLVPPPVGGVRTVPNASAVSLNPQNIAAKLGRTHSMVEIGRTNSMGSRNSPTLGAITTVPPVPMPVPLTSAPRSKSAASIVAGVHSVKASSSAEDPHTTLTSLVPLKRATKATKPDESMKIPPPTAPQRSTKNKSTIGLRIGSTGSNNASLPVMMMPSSNSFVSNIPLGLSSIGGDVIGGPSLPTTVVPGLTMLGGSSEFAHSSALGGEVFTGQLPNKASSTIGRSEDKWNSNQVVGGDPIGGGGLFGNGSNSTSALASILGVNLPTGSGSLRESSNNLWPSSPLSALNGSAMGGEVGFIGGSPVNINGSNTITGSSLIGGIPIGGIGHSSLGASRAVGGSYDSRNDFALLQSLLPGVHISDGGTTDGWNQPGPVGGGLGGETLPGWSAPRTSSAAVGAIGQSHGQQNHRQAGPGIW